MVGLGAFRSRNHRLWMEVHVSGIVKGMKPGDGVVCRPRGPAVLDNRLVSVCLLRRAEQTKVVVAVAVAATPLARTGDSRNGIYHVRTVAQGNGLLLLDLDVRLSLGLDLDAIVFGVLSLSLSLGDIRLHILIVVRVGGGWGLAFLRRTLRRRVRRSQSALGLGVGTAASGGAVGLQEPLVTFSTVQKCSVSG